MIISDNEQLILQLSLQFHVGIALITKHSTTDRINNVSTCIIISQSKRRNIYLQLRRLILSLRVVIFETFASFSDTWRYSFAETKTSLTMA